MLQGRNHGIIIYLPDSDTTFLPSLLPGSFQLLAEKAISPSQWEKHEDIS